MIGRVLTFILVRLSSNSTTPVNMRGSNDVRFESLTKFVQRIYHAVCLTSPTAGLLAVVYLDGPLLNSLRTCSELKKLVSVLHFSMIREGRQQLSCFHNLGTNFLWSQTQCMFEGHFIHNS